MKIKLNPFLKAVRGKMGDTVFRICHTGELQVISCPDMKKVKWSEAQKEHRRKFRDAVDYAKVCMMLPELHAYYLEKAHKRGTNRPFDEAVREYFQGNLLPFDYKRPQVRMEEQNTAISASAKQRSRHSGPESVPQPENAAVQKPDNSQPAGLTNTPVTVTAPSTGPAPLESGWTFRPLVLSNSMNGENDFYCVTTMCIVTVGTAARLPEEIQV